MNTFVGMRESLSEHGILILVAHRSIASLRLPASKAGHVELQGRAGDEDLLQRFFHTVFVFSMTTNGPHRVLSHGHYVFGLDVPALKILFLLLRRWLDRASLRDRYLHAKYLSRDNRRPGNIRTSIWALRG